MCWLWNIDADGSTAVDQNPILITVSNMERPTPDPGEPWYINGSCMLGPEPPLSDLYHWSEITQPFLEATRDLDLEELLHDDLFGLFEAMSAIEMMDPKMDAGMLCNRQNRKPHTFQTAKESGYLKIHNMSSADQIAIMDSTLSCLVTWLEGHSLAQTMFTNLYLHCPYEIENPTLKAFSIVTLKLVDIIRDVLSKGCVYEEEDFQPMTYNFKLCEDVSPVRTGGMLREVEDDLLRIQRNAKSKDDPAIHQEHEEAGALFARIRFCRMFYLGLVSLTKHDIPEGQRQLASAIDQISAISSTIHIGTEADITKDNPIGFERLANQRLLPPTFPRYTEIKSRDDSIMFLKKLTENLLEATGIAQVASFPGALEFFSCFSAQQSCVVARSMLQILYQPLYVMSQLPGITLAMDRRLQNVPLFQDLLRDACKSFIAPPAIANMSNVAPYNSKQSNLIKVNPSNRDEISLFVASDSANLARIRAFLAQIKDCLDNFFNQCCRSLGLLLQTFGHNQARQRDKIAALLEEFASVQEEANKLDNMLNSLLSSSEGGSRQHMLYFSTWLLYHVLRLMVRYLLSGFELELYSTHEYPYLYWYLFELLYPWLITCLHRADSYLLEQEQIAESHRNAGKNKKKVKNANKKKTARPYLREIALHQGHGTLCAGYFKLLVALKKESKLLVPDSTFDNECVRYEHRFLPFASLLTPPIMPYGQYLEVYEHTEQSSPADLFHAACNDFQRARQNFQALASSQSASSGVIVPNSEDVHSLVAVCKNNCVVAGILSRDCSRTVSFEFVTNITFPSVKLN